MLEPAPSQKLPPRDNNGLEVEKKTLSLQYQEDIVLVTLISV